MCVCLSVSLQEKEGVKKERERECVSVCVLSSLSLLLMYVMVGTDKPLARLIVVRCLEVDKSQVLWSGMLDTPLSLHGLI